MNYTFKSRKCSPQHKDLMQFENDLLELIKRVKFKKAKNKFLDQQHKYISSNKKSKPAFIFVDKTRNIYVKYMLSVEIRISSTLQITNTYRHNCLLKTSFRKTIIKYF